jgi:hypothetical protein
MNDGEMPGRELVPDDWRDLDDTLADGPAAASVPGEAKSWLADQRTMHGLLRAMHTADPSARESRVETVLARIDAERQRSPALRWAAVAALALLLAALGTWAWLPAALPTAEATVQRAASELDRAVDRRFKLVVAGKDKQGRPMLRQEFALLTHAGARFRLEGRIALGKLRVPIRLGCDGTDLWLDSNGLRRSLPLAQRERLLGPLGDALDVGYLDLQHLLRELRTDRDLRVVGRERAADGRSLLRVEAIGKSKIAERRGMLLCDEQSGMVVRLAMDVTTNRGDGRTIELEYLGEEPPGLADFQRPW